MAFAGLPVVTSLPVDCVCGPQIRLLSHFSSFTIIPCCLWRWGVSQFVSIPDLFVGSVCGFQYVSSLYFSPVTFLLSVSFLPVFPVFLFSCLGFLLRAGAIRGFFVAVSSVRTFIASFLASAFLGFFYLRAGAIRGLFIVVSFAFHRVLSCLGLLPKHFSIFHGFTDFSIWWIFKWQLSFRLLSMNSQIWYL